MPGHDLVRYRESGELSDLTVRLGNKAEWKLHRFPLFIKSEKFRQLLSDSNVSSELELPADFPGGADCFALVADFCYNKRIDISPENVVQLRCAAEHLAMRGRGNLADLTDRYLDELLGAAKASRSAGPVVELLTSCGAVGQPADDIKLSERCLAVLLDIWHRAESAAAAAAALSNTSEAYHYGHQHRYHHRHSFSPLYSDLKQQEKQQQETEHHLLNLALPRFLQLIRAVCPMSEDEASDGTESDAAHRELTREANAHLRRRPLAELVARYLDRAFSRHLTPPQQQAPTPPERELSAKSAAEEPPPPPTAAAEADLKTDEERDQDDSTMPRREEEQSKEEESNSQETTDSAVNILDRVILALPDDTPLSEAINADWIRRALRVSETASQECRAKLLQLAGGALHRFSQDELRETPAPVLCEIVENTVKNDGVVPEVLSCVVDSHLLDLARTGGLTVPDFVKLAASMPADYRTSHDTLYEAAEALLTAEPTPTDSERQQVIASLDLNRCSEATLQRALDKGVVPANLICQAAIDVAKKLRQQLEEREKLRTENYRSFRRQLHVTAGLSDYSATGRHPEFSASPVNYRRVDRPSIGAQLSPQSYHPSTIEDQSHQMEFEDYLSSIGSARAAGTTVYSVPYASSRQKDDDCLTQFEENLRAELSKISANYDNYLAEWIASSSGSGARAAHFRASFRSHPASGKRW